MTGSTYLTSHWTRDHNLRVSSGVISEMNLLKSNYIFKIWIVSGSCSTSRVSLREIIMCDVLLMEIWKEQNGCVIVYIYQWENWGSYIRQGSFQVGKSISITVVVVRKQRFRFPLLFNTDSLRFIFTFRTGIAFIKQLQ